MIVGTRFLRKDSYRIEQVITYISGTSDIGNILVFKQDGEEEIQYTQQSNGGFVNLKGDSANDEETKVWREDISFVENEWRNPDSDLHSRTRV